MITLESPAMSVKRSALLVLKDYLLENKPSSHHTYSWHAESISQDLGPKRDLATLKKLELQDWVNQMKPTCKPATIRHKVSFLNRMFIKADDLGFPCGRPTKELRLPKINNKRRVHSGLEEIALLATVMPAWRISILEIAYHTGLRRLEIYQLRPEHIETFFRTITMENGETIEVELGYARIPESKTHEERVICLNVEATRRIKEWMRIAEGCGAKWLIGPYHDKRLDIANNFSCVLRRACNKLGIKTSMHLFRQSYTRIWCMAGKKR